MAERGGGVAPARRGTAALFAAAVAAAAVVGAQPSQTPKHPFISGWDHILRTAAIGLLAYVGMIVMLRIGGKRTLVKLNVFDFAGTVALGSALATTILSSDVSLVEGLIGIGVIVTAQSALAWTLNHSSPIERIVNGQPTLLVHRGRLREDALDRQHITIEELRAALRGKGIGDLEDVEALVLETDGTFSVLRADASKTYWALVDVPGIEPAEAHASDDARTGGGGDRGGDGGGGDAGKSGGGRPRPGADARQAAESDEQHGHA